MPNIHGFGNLGKPVNSSLSNNNNSLNKVASSASSPAKVVKKSSIGRPSCGVKKCTAKVNNIMGLCDKCSTSHCAKHRLPENHECSGLAKAKEEARKAQGEKTMKEATKGDSKMVDRI